MEIPTKTSPYTLGVDLGTTNSVIAIWDDEKREAIVIEANAQRIMPSVVSFEKRGETTVRHVGTEAKNRAVAFPGETILSIKDHMGSNKILEVLGEKYTPENIAAILLEELRRRALTGGFDWWGALPREDDYEILIQKAVITVPANFDPKQIRGTIEAAQQSGFDRFVEILKEPVAAALAFGVQRARGKKIVLVYDFGGGTFDVAIIEVDIDPEEGFTDRSVLEPKWYGGDNDLGGDNIDELVVNFLHTEFKRQNGDKVDLLDLQADDGVTQRMKRRAQQSLSVLAEEIKIELGNSDAIEISKMLAKDESGSPLSLELKVTREKLEDMVEPIVERTLEVVRDTVEKSGLGFEQIDEVILVGGSSNLTSVRRKLKKLFGKEPSATADTATAVAQGAALWGHLCETLGAKRLPDIAPYTIGLLVEGERFTPLIEQGTTIDPEQGYTCPSQSFYNQVDDIPQLRVEIYKQLGEGRFIFDTYTTENGEERPCFVRIGRFFIDDLPPRPSGEIQVDVSCAISPKGELSVTATFEGQPWPRDGRPLSGWY